MADQKGTPIPQSAVKAAPTYHWWYDAGKAGVRNSPPSNMVSTPSNSFGYLSKSPTSGGIATAIPMPMSRVRRDSLKNMVHLCDFATP